MTGLHERIRQRLRETGKSARRASIDSQLSPEAISKILRQPDHSQTLETISKLAKGLGVSEPWLAFGVAGPCDPPDEGSPRGSGTAHVSADLLSQVLRFVLVHEGVPDRRADALAHILPAALAGPPVDAVQGDPFLSFRVHFQLQAPKSEPSASQ